MGNTTISHLEKNAQQFNGTTVQKVVQYIEDEIKSGRLHAGNKIPTEAELCSLLNVSRTSVREAIKIMESMTVVSVRRGAGTYITQPNNISVYSSLKFKMLLNGTTWNELCEFREQMEFAVIRCAIHNATPADISILDELNKQLSAHQKSEAYDHHEFFKLDVAFHTQLAKAAHNRMLEDTYNYSFEIFSPLILGNYKAGQGIEPTIESHSTFYDALVNKDLFLAGYAAHNAVSLWSKWAKKQDRPFFPIME